ncbi:MAG: hypothetical protein R2771_07465 [Saprospiraceae bacterium]
MVQENHYIGDNIIDLKRYGDFEWFGGEYGENHRKHIGAILETPNFYPLEIWY